MKPYFQTLCLRRLNNSRGKTIDELLSAAGWQVQDRSAPTSPLGVASPFASFH